MSIAASTAALAIAAVIGLGRQITVFTVFEPGLALFRRFHRKRNLGLAAMAALTAIALASGLEDPATGLLIAAWALGLFSVVFELDLLFPALSNVRSVPAELAASDYIDDGGRVVVVTAGDERRAYPLERMVMARHLVHDRLGDTPIVVTYCALCRSGLAFRSELDGKQLAFAVVGVFRRNLVMEDAQTGTLWQQATGEAIHGPHRGARLELLASEQLPWPRVADDPGLTVAIEPPSARRAPFASARGLSLLERATERVMVPGRTRLAGGVAPRETVFGIQLGGAAKAYPEARLTDGAAFTDRLAGVELELVYDAHDRSLSVRRVDGEAPPVVECHWWLGWNEFHPRSEVYEG